MSVLLGKPNRYGTHRLATGGRYVVVATEPGDFIDEVFETSLVAAREGVDPAHGLLKARDIERLLFVGKAQTGQPTGDTPLALHVPSRVNQIFQQRFVRVVDRDRLLFCCASGQE